MGESYISGVGGWDSGEDFVNKFCAKCQKIDDCISKSRWCINPIGSQFKPRQMPKKGDTFVCGGDEEK